MTSCLFKDVMIDRCKSMLYLIVSYEIFTRLGLNHVKENQIQDIHNLWKILWSSKNCQIY